MRARAEPMSPEVYAVQGGVADPVQRVDLVEVHVAVDEALGDQPAGGVDLVAAR